VGCVLCESLLCRCPQPPPPDPDLVAWAAVGRSGMCVHSSTVEDCAGCQVRNFRAAIRRTAQDLIDIAHDYHVLDPRRLRARLILEELK
jgi:hypothetical protein